MCKAGPSPAARPSAPRSGTSKAFTVFTILALSSIGCGVQGQTRPPRIEQPEKVTDLTVIQIGKTIRFNFSIPHVATDGERLTKPLEVEILRETVTSGATACAAEGSLSPWRSFLQDDIEKHRKGGSLEFIVLFSAQEAPPAHLRFAVRTLTRGFRHRPLLSEFSNIVEISLLNAPDAPGTLRAVTTEKAIEIAWQAPPQTISRYRLYRSTTAAADSFKVVAETVSADYRDTDFEFGRTYFYKVTALVKDGASTAASGDSEILEVIPRDTFPPAQPRGLTAVFTTDAVELIWDASTEGDLAGYRVYRREEGLEELGISSSLLSTPIFRDAGTSPGKKYVYRVTALDLTGNESSHSEGVSAEVP